MRSTLIALTWMLIASLDGCVVDRGPEVEEIVAGRTWTAEALDGKDVIDGTTVTMKIQGDRVSGKAGCNGYGGTVEISGDRIKFGTLFSTKMACMGNGVMEQEQHYLTVLRDVTRGALRGDGTLILTGSSGTLEFRQ
jgi:heat shock protein HslJ